MFCFLNYFSWSRGQKSDFSILTTAAGLDVITSSSGKLIGQCSWTIGEPITETFSGSKKHLTQGFEQGKGYIKDTVHIFTGNEKSDILFSITIYPNPTQDILHIQIKTEELLCSLNVTVLDSYGRCIWTRQKVGLDNLREVDVSNWENGIYFLRLSFCEGRGSKVFRIIKVS